MSCPVQNIGFLPPSIDLKMLELRPTAGDHGDFGFGPSVGKPQKLVIDLITAVTALYDNTRVFFFSHKQKMFLWMGVQ